MTNGVCVHIGTSQTRSDVVKVIEELLLIITAYLIGSIPTALIISKSVFDIDIREYGSGNMGALTASVFVR